MQMAMVIRTFVGGRAESMVMPASMMMAPALYMVSAESM